MIYTAGSGPFQCVTPFQGGTTVTTGGGDGAWVNTSMYIGNTGSVIVIKPFGPVADGWFHFIHQNSGRGWNNNFVASLRSADTTQRVRIFGHAAQVYVNNVWTTFATGIPAVGGINQFDIYVKAATLIGGGKVEFYYNKELLGTYVGDTSAMVINDMLFGNPITFGGDSAYNSELLVADFPTLFSRVRQVPLTLNGTHTAWTGDVTAIDEAVPSSGDFIYTNTVDALESFKAPARVFTGYTIKGILTMFDGLKGGAAAPPRIRGVLRVGGVDYFTPNRDLTFGRKEFTEIFEVNPATGFGWTVGQAEDANLEAGIQARA